MVNVNLIDNFWLNKKIQKKQGYKARLDESLGMRRGKESTKTQTYKSRRAESIGMKKALRKKPYSSVKTMDRGNRNKKILSTQQTGVIVKVLPQIRHTKEGRPYLKSPKRDQGRVALPSGKRISRTGREYWETRVNRSDAMGSRV